MKRAHTGADDGAGAAKRGRRVVLNLPRVLCSLVVNFLTLREIACVARLSQYWMAVVRSFDRHASSTYTVHTFDASSAFWASAVAQRLHVVTFAPHAPPAPAFDAALPHALTHMARDMPLLHRLTLYSLPRVFYAWNAYQLPRALRILVVDIDWSQPLPADAVALMRAIGTLSQLHELVLRANYAGYAPLQTLPALRRVEVGTWLTNVEQQVIPLLQVLTLRHVAVGALNAACAHAIAQADVAWNKFELHWVPDVSIATPAVSSMRALTALDVVSNVDVDALLLRARSSKLELLELVVYGAPHAQPATLAIALPAAYPHLRDLLLMGDHFAISSRDMEVCLRGLPRLTCLQLSGLRALDNIDFLVAVEQTLTKLVLDDLELPLTAAALARLLAMDQLRVLHLNHAFTTALCDTHMYPFEMEAFKPPLLRDLQYA